MNFVAVHFDFIKKYIKVEEIKDFIKFKQIYKGWQLIKFDFSVKK